MIKVRFNLGRGKNYMKWKVQFPDKSSVYYSPEEISLQMENCTLKNNSKMANRIYSGENKSVCAWILCEKLVVQIGNNISYPESDRIMYNPKKYPYWTDIMEQNIDNAKIPQIKTNQKKLYK